VRGHLARLGRQTFVYGLSATAIQAVGLITLPVFARVFTPAEYGAVEIAAVGLSAAVLVADLGLASASQRSFFDYTDAQAHERRRVLATAMATALAASVTIGALLVAFREPVADWLFDGQLYTTLVVLVGVAIPLSIVAALARGVMRLHFRPGQYAVSATLAAVISGGLGVGLVLWTDVGIEAVLIGAVAGNAASALFGLAVTAGEFRAPVSRSELRTMLAYGLPLIPAAAALWGLSFLDRVMLSRLGNLSDVGEYAVAARFSMVLMLTVSAFGLAFSPFVLSLWSEDAETEKLIRARALTYLTIVLAGLSLLLALFARELTSIVAPAFDNAYEVVGILCFGVTLFGISSVTMTGIMLVRRTRLFAIYSAAAVVLNLVACVVLIPPFGSTGAALATAIGYGLLAVGYYAHAQRLYPTPYEPRKALTVLAAAAVVMPLGLLPLGPASVALKLGGVAFFLAALAVLHVFDPAERDELRETVRRIARAAGGRTGAAGPT
jgi:O-antigen/teichoic acid export membrane protein